MRPNADPMHTHVNNHRDEHGILHEEHPLDNYFRELIRRRRAELLRRKRAALKAVQAVVAMSGLRRRLEAAAGASACGGRVHCAAGGRVI